MSRKCTEMSSYFSKKEGSLRKWIKWTVILHTCISVLSWTVLCLNDFRPCCDRRRHIGPTYIYQTIKLHQTASGSNPHVRAVECVLDRVCSWKWVEWEWFTVHRRTLLHPSPPFRAQKRVHLSCPQRWVGGPIPPVELFKNNNPPPCLH